MAVPRPVIVTPPAEEPFSLQQVKDFLGVVTVLRDNDLTRMIQGARRRVEEVDVKHQLVTATYDWSIPGFFDPLRRDKLPMHVRRSWDAFGYSHHTDDEAIRLPKPPLQSVTSISYRDTDGDTQVLSTDVYDVDTALRPGEVFLKPAQVWPATQDHRKAVTIRFVCGYGAASDIPADLQHGMLTLISHWYENADAVDIADGFRLKEVPLTYLDLVSAYEDITMR